ncbi:uncharacterized protein LOC100198789 isoform X1 [Hydra vulgaris]|uniref:uncharacterized protein LOC100198789 isoform X1 n=2 Tax=Hydra vulgaris TaxID=6087 RepID=UPI001F5EA393|nr:uncharacterized protein LOC100198789 [Hydra vulgaris]
MEEKRSYIRYTATFSIMKNREMLLWWIVLLLKIKYSALQSIVISKNFSSALPVLPSVLIYGKDYVTINTGTFDLSNVNGPTDGDQGTFYAGPENCTNYRFIFPPNNYFCSNQLNGDIYLTNWYTVRPPKYNSTYTITINLNNGTQAIVQYVLTVQLLLPTCFTSKSLSYILNPFGSSVCSSFINSAALSQTTTLPNVTFNLNIIKEMLNIVGFRVFIPSQSINISLNPTLVIKIVDKMNNEFLFNQTILDFKLVQNVSTPLNYIYSVGDTLKVTLNIITSTETLPVPSRSTVIVAFITDWSLCSSMNKQCLQSYFKFNRTYSSCGIPDPDFLYIYNKCFDFIFSPLMNSTIVAKASSVSSIPRCQLISQISTVSITKEDIFWIKDGVLRINATDNPSPSQAAGILTLLFPVLQINKTTLSDSGVYQCAVQAVDQMVQPVFSDKIIVKVLAQTVVFVSQIQFQNINNYASLFNCKYNADEDLSAFSYWLLNGNIKFETFNSYKNRNFQYNVLPIQIGQYEVPPLQIVNYNMVGSYQCVIFNNKTMDREFKSDAFVIPKQPEPMFLNKPILTTSSLVYINIIGCSFDTYYALNYEDVFFIKDDSIKIYTAANLASNIEYFNPPYTYKMNNLAIEGVTYYDQGYYQCAININGYSLKEIRSAQVDVLLPYTSNTKIFLKLNEVWKSEYLNQSSAAFIELKNTVEIKIKQVVLTVTKNVTGSSLGTIVQITEMRPGSVYVTSRLTFTGVNDSIKLQIYNAFLQSSVIDSFKQLNVLNAQLTSLDYCPQSVFGEANYKGEYIFEVTGVDQFVTKNCTYQTKGVFYRKCIGNLKDGPAWDTPDLSPCDPKTQTTKILEYLSKQKICVDSSMINCSLINVVSKNLSDAVANGSAITNYHDVNFISKVLEIIVSMFPNATGASMQVFIDVLKTIDVVLESNGTYIAESQIKTSSSTSILNTLTEFALIYSKQLSNPISIGKRNIGFYIGKVKKSYLIISAHQLPNNSVEISFNSIADFSNKTYAVMKLPSDVFSNENEVVYSYFFRYDSFLLNEDNLLKLAEKNTSNKSFLQSTILSATVANKNVSNLSNPIILTFKKMHHQDLGTSSCNYWDKNFETEFQNVYGKWLTNGCYEYRDGVNTDDYFSCACNHLTNFALALDVNQKFDNPLALAIVTYIGCGISLVGLFLTLLTFALFRKLRQKLPQKILICFCVSLMGFLLVFLVGAEKASPRLGCQIISALIHYFILSTFCWMLVEAFNLYRSFIVIFKKSNDSSVFRNANFFAWGVPGVIVIITGVLKPDQLGNNKVCVVQGYPFYFAVLLPVCLILLVNFIVLISTMFSLSKRVVTTNKIPEKYYYLTQARIGFMCSTLLGSSWLFGVLAVGDLSTVFQWLFCISTSLQGFFIFVFYMLRNNEVFVEWRHFFLRFWEYDTSLSNAQSINGQSQVQSDGSLSSNIQLNQIQ